MSLPPDVKITTQSLLTGMVLFGLIDLIYIPILSKIIKRTAFADAKWAIIGSSAIVWFSIWAWVLSWSWDLVYVYIFPAGLRGTLPYIMALFYALVAWLLWRVALLPHGNPVVLFCLMGGLVGILTHIQAVSLGITTKPPMLQGASPIAAIAFAAFEFALYWCVILSIAEILHWLFRRIWRVA